MADDLIFDPALEDLEDDGWLPAVAAMGERNGWHEALGARHHAIHIDRKPSLVVTFERIDEVQEAAPGAEPAGILFARQSGWSALTILSERRTWFRDEAVYDLFDRLIDDGFFDEFDEVLFYGSGPDCGYAACAFSVASPGARVLALAPMATGDPRLTGWDGRHREARRLDFTSRYGFAPEMIEAAERVAILHDPEVANDSMHAALLSRPNVELVPMRHFGRALDVALHRLGIWNEVLAGFGSGRLTRARFAELMRARRADFHYLRALVLSLKSSGQRQREAMVLRAIDGRVDHRFFRRRARALQDELEALDDELPRREAV